MRGEHSRAEPSIAPGATRWTLWAACSRAVRVVREDGIRALLAGVLGETVYRRLVLVELDLTDEPQRTPNVAGVSFGWLDANSLEAYEELRPGRGAQAKSRLEDGDRCFASWLDGRLAAVRWLAAGSPNVEYLDVRLPLALGEIYQYDTFTDPALRRRGLSAMSQAELFLLLQAEGHRSTVRAILPENVAAARDAATAGYSVCGRIGFVRLGPWRREFVRRRSRGSVAGPGQ